MFHCRADQRTETMKEGEISLEPAQPPPPPDGLHLHQLRLGLVEPGEGGGGKVAELVLEGGVMSDTEEHGEQEGQGDVGQEEEAVCCEEHVEEVLLNSDHVEWEGSEV